MKLNDLFSIHLHRHVISNENLRSILHLSPQVENGAEMFRFAQHDNAIIMR